MQPITTFAGTDNHVGDPISLGIVTVSDRASQGEYTDEGGPAILGFFEEAINSPWTALYRCVPDEREAVEAALIQLADKEGCHVVVTTGGTGPAPRDITPEATEAVCDRMMPGFGEQMRSISLAFVPTAILSRQVGGLRNSNPHLQSPRPTEGHQGKPSTKYGRRCRIALTYSAAPTWT